MGDVLRPSAFRLAGLNGLVNSSKRVFLLSYKLMNSFTLYWVAALLQTAAIVAGVFGYLAQQVEGEAGRSADKKELISSAQADKKEILSGAQTDKKEIIASHDGGVEAILKQLQERNKSLKDRLWEEFPYGYVLFGSQGGDVVSIPFYRGDLQVEADWGKTEVRLDRQRKTAEIAIQQPIWKHDSAISHVRVVAGQGGWRGRYELGKAVRMGIVKVEGQPGMYFEVIDDDQRSPVWVIGFKK